MAFTQEDLQSAAAKLATLDFTPAELEAIATTIRSGGSPGTGGSESAEVNGFVFEPNDGLLLAKGFIPTVAGLMEQPGKGYTDPGRVTYGIISTETGETI